MIDKVTTIEKAVDFVKNGDTLMVGGFGIQGCALSLLRELARRPVYGLTTVSEDAGFVFGAIDQAVPALLEKGQIKKLCLSFLGGNQTAHSQINSGKLELDLIPQGTLAERIRIAGAGIGGFYTPTGVGTVVEEGKEKKTIDGKEYLLELPLRANVAFIKAYQADRMGNATFKYAAMNFNPLMAMAADITIVEAEKIVEPGEIEPDHVHLPGVFVDYVVCSEGVKRSE